MKYPTKSSHKKKIAIVIASVIMLAGAAFLVYFFLLGGNGSSESSTNTDIRSTNDVDYSGPSAEDISNSQNGKKNSESDDTKTNTDKVTVGITYAEVIESNLDVRAFTPSVIEGTGTCTAILIKPGEAAVKKSTKAFIDASSSQCQPIYINVSEFPSKGTWSLKVEYSSPTHSGTSESVEVKI